MLKARAMPPRKSKPHLFVLEGAWAIQYAPRLIGENIVVDAFRWAEAFNARNDRPGHPRSRSSCA